MAKPKPLTIKQILTWADQHQEWTGRWPIRHAGPVLGQPGETWERIADAMAKGTRGLKGDISLTKLLARRRGAQDARRIRSNLTRGQIIEWARLHHMRTGKWPRRDSGRVASAPDLSWSTIHASLRRGGENLPGGESLPQVLRKEFFIWSSRGNRPLSLTLTLILKWADDHYSRKGRWPIVMSGQVPRQKHTWAAINEALKHGRCGLTGGTTLTRLLRQHRGVAYDKRLRQLTEMQILDWADEYHRRHRRWPNPKSGYWPSAKLHWSTINRALREGLQGLPGGSSLSALWRPSAVPWNPASDNRDAPEAHGHRRKISSRRARRSGSQGLLCHSMPTNSAMPATASDYFGSMAESYDSLIRRCVPRYAEMTDRLLDYLPPKADRILELGCGTGNLSLRLAEKYPNAAITFVDAAPEMSELSRLRLRDKHPRIIQCSTFITARFEDLDLPRGHFDLITSCISLHHVRDKAALYAALFDATAPGGTFRFADQLRGSTDAIHDLNWRRWLEFCRAPGNCSEEEVRSLLDHAAAHDHYTPLREHFRMLEDAGFTACDCVWRNLIWGIVTAERDG